MCFNFKIGGFFFSCLKLKFDFENPNLLVNFSRYQGLMRAFSFLSSCICNSWHV